MLFSIKRMSHAFNFCPISDFFFLVRIQCKDGCPGVSLTMTVADVDCWGSMNRRRTQRFFSRIIFQTPSCVVQGLSKSRKTESWLQSLGLILSFTCELMSFLLLTCSQGGANAQDCSCLLLLYPWLEVVGLSLDGEALTYWTWGTLGSQGAPSPHCFLTSDVGLDSYFLCDFILWKLYLFWSSPLAFMAAMAGSSRGQI